MGQQMRRVNVMDARGEWSSRDYALFLFPEMMSNLTCLSREDCLYYLFACGFDEIRMQASVLKPFDV